MLAQAFTLYERSVGDAKMAFKKTLADDSEMQFVVFPLDVMVAKQELNVIMPPLPPDPSPPASPPATRLASPPASPLASPEVTLPPPPPPPNMRNDKDKGDKIRYLKSKARAMALWELNYRTRPCENPDFVECGQCAYGGKCRFFHKLSDRRCPPTDAMIDKLADQYFIGLSTKTRWQ